VAAPSLRTLRFALSCSAQLLGVNALVRDLKERNIRTETRPLATGGIPFERGALFYLLRNRFYIGEVRYKGEILPGEQPPIMERAQQWDAAPRTTLLNPWVEQVEQNRLGHSNQVLWSAVFVLRLVLPEFAALDPSFLHLGDAMLLGLYRRVNPKDLPTTWPAQSSACGSFRLLSEIQAVLERTAAVARKMGSLTQLLFCEFRNSCRSWSITGAAHRTARSLP